MGCKYTGLVSAVIPFGLLALLETLRRRSSVLLGCYVLGWAVVIVAVAAQKRDRHQKPGLSAGMPGFSSPEWDQRARSNGKRRTAARLISGVEELGRRLVASPHAAQRRVPGGASTGHYPRASRQSARSKKSRSRRCAILELLSRRGGALTGSRRCTLHWPRWRSLRRGSRRLALVLWRFVAYMFLTWWFMTHRLDRFWLPILPPLAILAGLGADWARSRSWSILLGIVLGIGVFVNFVYISTALAGLNEWTADLVFLRRDIPRRWNRALARLDEELPPDARPLLVGQAAVFHMNHQVAYNTVFNLETIELLAKGKSTNEFRRDIG